MTFILKYDRLVNENEERYEAHLLSWSLVGKGDCSTFGRIQTPKEESPRGVSDHFLCRFWGNFTPDVCGIYVVVHTGGKYLQVT